MKKETVKKLAFSLGFVALLIGLILLLLNRCGLVTELPFRVSVLLAAMPAAATTSMLSSKYDCAPDFGTKMVIMSTLCSIPTIFVWGLLLKASG